GLAARQQQHLLQLVSPALVRRGKARGPRLASQELREMWQAIGSCERLPAAARAELGGVLVAEAERGRVTDAELWSLARLGARVQARLLDESLPAGLRLRTDGGA